MDTLNASPAHTADNPLPDFDLSDFDIDDMSNKLSVGLRALQLVRKLRAACTTLLTRWRSE